MNTLILLPGALGSIKQYDELVTELEGLGIKSIPFDLPGHGLNPTNNKAITVPLMAEALMLSWLELELEEPFNIFGHSLGGYLGVYLCMTYPQKINRVYTLGTKWHWTNEIAEKETSFLNLGKMELKVPAYVEQLKRNHMNSLEELMDSIKWLMNDLGHNQYLQKENRVEINHNVRISLGDRDSMVTLEETIAMYRDLAHAELQIHPATPHPIEKVNKKRLALDMAVFFDY